MIRGHTANKFEWTRIAEEERRHAADRSIRRFYLDSAQATARAHQAEMNRFKC